MPSEVLQSPSLVEALLDPKAYPHPVRDLSLLQTHASWLFFTGDRVYKVKKPVNYGFLDFSTLAKRRRYCRLETSLNRRLSPEVYLGAVEIRRLGGRVTVGGSAGEVVDYAVQMKRLPSRDSLAERLASGRLGIPEVRQIAAKAVQFHQSAKTGPAVARKGGWAAVRRRVLDNLADLGPGFGFVFPAEDLLELAAYSTGFLRARAGLIRRRARRGRVRDGHGDLHAGNVFLVDGQVRIIDCVEFNDRLRCMDVAEDIAFLAMDLDYHGRSDLSREFVAEYARLARDDEIHGLLDFFKVYRALVRAKVDRLQAANPEMGDPERRRLRNAAAEYFRLALRYLESARPGPVLIAFGGLTGAGKTTLSRHLAQRWRAVRLASDPIRKRLAGVPPESRQIEPYGEGIYNPEFTRRTYREMLSRARRRLAEGKTVLLDASFLREDDRVAALEVARASGVDFRFVECRARGAELTRRLRLRRAGRGDAVSDGRIEILRRQRKLRQPHRGVPPANRLTLETGGPFEESFGTLLERLYRSAMFEI